LKKWQWEQLIINLNHFIEKQWRTRGVTGHDDGGKPF
jgi:hypothetical protein